MTIWTPPALASEARGYARELWRAVEAQHTASTMRLVDSLDEQQLLEGVLEESKPPLPPEARGLHYLLATPFRYRSPTGSRFRAPFEAGVWYGAEALRTALAEKSYWRLRFLIDSPGMPQLKPVPHTVFRARVASERSIDLTAAAFRAERAVWTAPLSYDGTQRLAAAARAAGIEVIRYESVRDPQRAACAAVLSPRAFGRGKPKASETWFIAASRERVRCARDQTTAAAWEFSAAQLAGTASS